MLLLPIAACATPEAAPRDLDALFHAFWADYAAQDDDALRADFTDLESITDESALPVDGTYSDLSRGEVLLVDVDVDPTPARGMYAIGWVDCTPAEMEKVLYATNQDELYEGNYTSYSREYTSDFDDYAARRTPQLSWDTTYGVDIPLFGSYVTTIHGGLHYVEGDDEPSFMSRTVMPEPADTDPDTVVVDLDFHIEAFYPYDGGMVHLFGMWRHIVLSDGLSTDDDTTVSLILGGLHDFDDDTTKICDDGRI